MSDKFYLFNPTILKFIFSVFVPFSVTEFAKEATALSKDFKLSIYMRLITFEIFLKMQQILHLTF